MPSAGGKKQSRDKNVEVIVHYHDPEDGQPIIFMVDPDKESSSPGGAMSMDAIQVPNLSTDEAKNETLNSDVQQTPLALQYHKDSSALSGSGGISLENVQGQTHVSKDTYSAPVTITHINRFYANSKHKNGREEAEDKNEVLKQPDESVKTNLLLSHNGK